MKRITIKNKGKKIGMLSFDDNKRYKSKFKLYEMNARNTYRELEYYYDAIYYTPYPNQTLYGIVASYEEDANKQKKIIEKIKHKNNIEEVTPFMKIRLYGVPSTHLKNFGLTDRLYETKSIRFIEDINKFINDNRKYIRRNDKNGFDVDIMNDEINDLNKIYQNYLNTNDEHVKNYLYPHLRDGYIDIIDRFKDLTGKDFLSKQRVYPLL